MITEYERTVLDLAAALAAQLIEGEKHYGQEAQQSSDDGTELRRLRDVSNASGGRGIRSIRRIAS